MAYTRLNPQPKGFDTTNQVDLLNYSSTNMYTVPAGGGVVRVDSNYRASTWARVYIYTGTESTYVQSSQSSSGGPGGTSQIIQVFAGQKLYGERDSTVQYGSVTFIPYAY